MGDMIVKGCAIGGHMMVKGVVVRAHDGEGSCGEST
jgi:hypothetical protein